MYRAAMCLAWGSDLNIVRIKTTIITPSVRKSAAASRRYTSILMIVSSFTFASVQHEGHSYFTR